MKKIIFSCLWIIAIIVISTIYVNVLYPIKFREYVEKYSVSYNIDKELIYAIIRCESGFNEEKVSQAGACGLMQLMPSTMEYMGETSEKIFDPETNIMVGVKYLRYLIDKFGSEKLALCAYNAGEGNVRQWLRDERYSDDGTELQKIPFRETDRYVKRVTDSYNIYKKLAKK